ncbi:putative hydrolase of the HAD superfamily [Sphaerotilus mobilis]|uniref:Putative hydrolase of the HAD superfamily n=2 Tax=Sphaerotilus mobilis TaxID=47994 RepID=A0A4Q7LQT8_9BURK|nr:putative hydrolase of the HAD superfamily [Sphaerotilus mobilis]
MPPTARADNPRMTIRALTLDLDDTLWPLLPTLLRAERAMHDWLAEHAPATARMHGIDAMRELRAEVGRRHPGLAHDLSQLRRVSLLEALRAAGDDPALAEPAFDAFFDARQQVVFYDEVADALDRLASRHRLLAVSNGNADLAATGLSRWFAGSVSARQAGVAKPDPRIFHQACAALDCAPDAVMHVGDDHAADIVGARAAGLHSAWLRREPERVGRIEIDPCAPSGHHWVIGDLTVLADRLLAD